MIRKYIAASALAGLTSVFAAPVSAGTVVTDGPDIVVKTKGGLEVATTDAAFGFKLGGRIQADYSTFDGAYTKNGERADAAYFRRAYLTLSGHAYRDWAYKLSYDFSHNSGNADNGYFDEASVTYKGFKPVSIRVGRFGPNFGLESATSSKWVTATERTAAYDIVDWAGSDGSGLGVQVGSTFGTSALAEASVLSKSPDDENGRNSLQFNGRAVFAPFHQAGDVLHFGLNLAHRDVSGREFDSRYRTRMGMRGVATAGGTSAGENGNRPVLGGASKSPAGAYASDSAMGLEAAWAKGPVSLQAEYVARRTRADDNAHHDIKGYGYSAQAAYTLTGEARGYKLGEFGQIKPANKDIGAWEVFYRFDGLSVRDDNFTTATAQHGLGNTGVKVHNLGVNWYANNAVRVSAVYAHALTDNITNANGDAGGNGLVLRGQYVF